MQEDLVGTVRVTPAKNVYLAGEHVATSSRKHQKGSRYRTWVGLLVRLMEFGGKDARALNVGRTAPMTRGFETGKNKVLDRVIAVIRDRLDLE
jgi:hypothetical protein